MKGTNLFLSTMNPTAVSRRKFLQQTALTTGAIAFPAVVRGANLNGKLQVAVVGSNGQGLSDLQEIGSHPKAQFVGFCDVDTARLGPAKDKFPGVATFQDFREMFSKLGDGIDAVQVSTPDHMHAFIAMTAMRLGKHVYCQKPLTHTVWEARQMRLQAAKSKVVTQMGNQIHSASEYRTAVKLIKDGVIGKIVATHSWIGNRGNGFTKLTAPPASGPVPPTLAWDNWLGCAPAREYAPNVYHFFNWRDWQDFGGGALGDFGCHILDPIFTALGITTPISVKAENTGVNDQTWPGEETINWVFPGNELTAGKTLPVTWWDGGRKPDAALAKLPDGAKLPPNGSLVIGEGGTIVIPHVARAQVYPQEKFNEFRFKPEPQGNHYHLWVDACLGGAKTTDGFDYAGPLTETVQLGNIATRVPGKELLWNGPELQVTNSPEANALVSKKYRAGWEIAPV